MNIRMSVKQLLDMWGYEEIHDGNMSGGSGNGKVRGTGDGYDDFIILPEGTKIHNRDIEKLAEKFADVYKTTTVDPRKFEQWLLRGQPGNTGSGY